MHTRKRLFGTTPENVGPKVLQVVRDARIVVGVTVPRSLHPR